MQKQISVSIMTLPIIIIINTVNFILEVNRSYILIFISCLRLQRVKLEKSDYFIFSEQLLAKTLIS